jgi:acyl-ACP thioesterase
MLDPSHSNIKQFTNLTLEIFKENCYTHLKARVKQQNNENSRDYKIINSDPIWIFLCLEILYIHLYVRDHMHTLYTLTPEACKLWLQEVHKLPNIQTELITQYSMFISMWKSAINGAGR